MWQAHLNPASVAPAWRAWLQSGGSLTARLKAHSTQFRVQRLHQRVALSLPDESAAIGLGRPGRVWEREVLLRCDNTPVVYAHTVVPMAATASDWPLFSTLGERSLGSTLFGDPLVRRAELEYAVLRPGHPLAQRARAALGLAAGMEGPDQRLYARRCLYRRRRGSLLVTEVFLPGVLALRPTSTNTITNLS
jgi:chorismate--pyruvate lyase